MAEMKTLWHKSDEDADWHPVALHAIDASHALEADPEHWRQSKPEEIIHAEGGDGSFDETSTDPAPEPEPETKPETEQ